MIGFICVLAYIAVALVSARVLYTKYANSEILDGKEFESDVALALCGGSLFWPVLILGWLTWKFITGGVRKK